MQQVLQKSPTVATSGQARAGAANKPAAAGGQLQTGEAGTRAAALADLQSGADQWPAVQRLRVLQQRANAGPRTDHIAATRAHLSRTDPADNAGAATNTQSRQAGIPVMQLKWIFDPNVNFLVWDRQLDGVRWIYLDDGRYYFIVEDPTESAGIAHLAGIKNARTLEEWIQAGFVEGEWKRSDREVVPFQPSRDERFKLANSDVEMTRGELEKQAIGFLEGGEAGDEGLLLKEYGEAIEKLTAEAAEALRTRRGLSKKNRIRMTEVWASFWGISKEGAESDWHEVMKQLLPELDALVREMLLDIKRDYGPTAYVEALNAATNLMKRFLGRSRKANPYLKIFEVLNQITGRMKSLEFRKEQPIIANPKPFNPKVEAPSGLQLGESISDVEKSYDVLSRRTGATKDSSIKHVHEVDLAFVPAFRGITEAYANPIPKTKELIFQGGGGVGEKVFAVNHQGAIDFRKEVKKTEERFYALLFPKGFIAHFGMDLMKLGGKGASAREPNEREFSKHVMPPKDLDPQILIPPDRLFFIRAEKSTKLEGQVDIHFGWRDMGVGGKKTSHAAFFRSHVVGVVEFTKTGHVIRFLPLGP